MKKYSSVMFVLLNSGHKERIPFVEAKSEDYLCEIMRVCNSDPRKGHIVYYVDDSCLDASSTHPKH